MKSTEGQPELEVIRQRFLKRDATASTLYPRFSSFQHFTRLEREYWIGYFLTKHFADPGSLMVLEVGAGAGSNIPAFLQFGVQRDHFYANELLPERAELLGAILPNQNVHTGDARTYPTQRKFDLIYISTVFSSVLDPKMKQELADHIYGLVKPGGLILWYDFVFNNPSNPNVKGVSLSELRGLFPQAEMQSHRVTLAPPIGRRVGWLYPWLNFPFLRTHVMVGIFKD